jgi:hypothetical protein
MSVLLVVPAVSAPAGHGRHWALPGLANAALYVLAGQAGGGGGDGKEGQPRANRSLWPREANGASYPCSCRPHPS